MSDVAQLSRYVDWRTLLGTVANEITVLELLDVVDAVKALPPATLKGKKMVDVKAALDKLPKCYKETTDG